MDFFLTFGYHLSMRWIYLSPHFDDAVLSCGGMIWEQVQRGEAVENWTICAGNLPRGDLSEFAAQKHAEWRVGRKVIAARREEDRQANGRVGAETRWWSLPDCIYRRLPDGEPLISENDDLWLPVHPGEMEHITRLRAWLRRGLKADDRLVVPLTLGNHVDHRLVRAAAEGLRRPLYYYADFPYVARSSLWQPRGLAEENIYTRAISEPALAAWQEGSGAYISQVSDLFGSHDGLLVQLREFWERGGGSFLWIN